MADRTSLRALRIAVLCCLAAFFLANVASPVADLDMWHEIALIRESIAAGRLLTVDHFAYTPTVNPVVDHEWGAGAVLYALTRGGAGWPVVAFKYLLALVTAALVLQCARLRGAAFATMSLLAPLGMVLFGLGCATLRAQAYTLLGIAVLVCFLELDDAGKRFWIPLWLIVFILWTNLHGGSIIAIVILGLHWAEQAVRRRPHSHLLGTLALSFLAMAVNPFGLAYYRHMWNTLKMPRPDIGEWWPIWRYSTFYTAVFCAALAIAGYAIAKLGLRAARGVPVLAAMAIASCLHVRMAPLFAVVWVAWVPAWASATPLGRRIGGLVQRRELITVLCLVLMMFLVPWFLRVRPLRLAVPNDVYPVGAVRYLAEEGFRGNVMAPFEVGAYVTWRLFPSAKVFVDSRYDIAFPPRIVEESFRFYKAEPGWQTILAEYPTDVVLARREAPVNRVMEAAGWKRVYVDRSFEIYARPDLRLALRNDSGKDFRGAFP